MTRQIEKVSSYEKASQGLLGGFVALGALGAGSYLFVGRRNLEDEG